MQRVAPGPYSLQLAYVVPGTTPSLAPPIHIPDGYQPDAVLPSGILIQEIRQGGALRVWRPAASGGGDFVRMLGQAEGVIDTFGDLVAWVDGSGACHAQALCPLHITNAASGADSVVGVPNGHQPVPGGSFSPDGTRLAFFVDTSANGEPAAELATVGADSGWSRPALVAQGILPFSGDGPAASAAPGNLRPVPGPKSAT